MADTVGNVYTFGSPEYGQLGEPYDTALPVLSNIIDSEFR